MHRHCGTNNRAPWWTFMDPCKPEVRPGAREESASPAWPANGHPPPISLYTNPWPFYQTQPLTELWEVSIEHLRRVWHADGWRLLLRTPAPVPFWTCICSTCCDQFFSRTCRYFPDYAIWTSLCTFSILLQILSLFYFTNSHWRSLDIRVRLCQYFFAYPILNWCVHLNIHGISYIWVVFFYCLQIILR